MNRPIGTNSAARRGPAGARDTFRTSDGKYIPELEHRRLRAVRPLVVVQFPQRHLLPEYKWDQ